MLTRPRLHTDNPLRALLPVPSRGPGASCFERTPPIQNKARGANATKGQGSTLHLSGLKNPNFKLADIQNGKPDMLAQADVEGNWLRLYQVLTLRDLADCEFPYSEVM